MSDNEELPPEIGPHNEQELDLLLAGEKPLAMFSDVVPASFDWGEKPFDPYVQAGRPVKHEDIIKLHYSKLYPWQGAEDDPRN